jgi:type VI secretion system protein ImpB
MPAESSQDLVGRNRPPRVQIKYEVHTGGAPEMRELPFVVGVIADLSGKPAEPLPRLRDREFVRISRDNFDDVLKGCKPRVAFQVENRLRDDGSLLPVELAFESIKDFEPEQVVQKIKALRELLEARRKLKNLLNKLDGNDTLDGLLQKVISDTESLRQIGKEVGWGGESPTPAEGDES